MSENLNKSVCMNSEDRKMKIESLKTEQENIKNKINLIQSTANEQINQLKMNFNSRVDPFSENQTKCCIENNCTPTTEDSSLMEKANNWNCKNVCSNPYNGLRL